MNRLTRRGERAAGWLAVAVLIGAMWLADFLGYVVAGGTS